MRELKKGKKERRLYTSLSETNKVALLTMVVREKRRGGGARGKEERSMERIERKGRWEGSGREESGFTHSHQQQIRQHCLPLFAIGTIPG